MRHYTLPLLNPNGISDDSFILVFVFVSRIRPATSGSNRVCWVPDVFPEVPLTTPQCLISFFAHFNLSRTSRAHSVWFLSLRDCYLLCVTIWLISYLLIGTLTSLHHNEINLEGDHGNAPCYPGSKPGILLYDSSPIILFAPHLENDSS